jgi:hypothetical protein
MEAMRRVLMKAIFEFEFELELVEWVGKASVLDWIGWLDVGEEMVGDGGWEGSTYTLGGSLLLEFTPFVVGL